MQHACCCIHYWFKWLIIGSYEPIIDARLIVCITIALSAKKIIVHCRIVTHEACILLSIRSMFRSIRSIAAKIAVVSMFCAKPTSAAMVIWPSAI